MGWAQNQLDVQILSTERLPQEGIMVSIESENELSLRTDWTDTSGFAHFELDTGKYQLVVDGGPGYVKLSRFLNLKTDEKLEFQLIKKSYNLPEVSVRSDYISPEAPVTSYSLERRRIEKINTGREIPMILQETPSLVAHADAGNGVGYSYLRIRGSDQTRINVTVNGIPLNDSESHQVFWVNMPDLTSSLGNVSIQRGVGSSSAGPGAFGANIRLNTGNQIRKNQIVLRSDVGSYKTYRNNIQVNQGPWQVRLSNIQSDGYMDRASSNMNAYFIQFQKELNNSEVKLLHFYGKERTYQSWYGVPESLATGDEVGLEAHIARNFYTSRQIENLRESDRRYNFYEYEDQVDNYGQGHLQAHWNELTGSGPWTFGASVHYTYGEGYFEQFDQNVESAAFGMPPLVLDMDTIRSGDAVQRRWLDNDFYGFNFRALYERGAFNIKSAIIANRYEGEHFGRLINADFIAAGTFPVYYRGNSTKDDLSAYVQSNIQRGPWLAYLDLQLRQIHYETSGSDNTLIDYNIKETYNFFNPKLGFQYARQSWRSYVNVGIANREPVRSDFLARSEIANPKSESLFNLELGIEKSGANYRYMLNGFYMQYQDQLVPTGELNDVGALVRRNIDESYRYGLELSAEQNWQKRWYLRIHGTFMRSRLLDWTEPVIDYGNDGLIEIEYDESPIAMSPEIMAFAELEYRPWDSFSVRLRQQYVGEQYLDNSGRIDRKMDDYFIQDFFAEYSIPTDLASITLTLYGACFNLWDLEYSAFGYSFNYAFNGDIVTENFLYPQATRNFNIGVKLDF
jgi:iron complex outermembrane receptor protein